MEEYRNSLRHKIFKGGSISFGALPAIDCIVRNLSATGACIEVKNAASVPDGFALIIKPEIICRACKVVWRRDGMIGVYFK